MKDQFTQKVGASDVYVAPKPKEPIQFETVQVELPEQEIQKQYTAFEAGFNEARLSEGKLGFFDTVEEQAYYNQVKTAPDYKENEAYYNAYATAGETVGLFANKDIWRKKYVRAVQDRVFELDENGNLTEGENYYKGATYLYDMTTVKGFLLAEKNGWNEDSLSTHYSEVVKSKKQQIEQAPKDTLSNIGGAISGYILAPETATDFASPGKIMASTIGKGMAKAFAVESSYVALGETMREKERAKHAEMLNQDRSLWDSTKEVLINSGFAGAIRGIGSGIYDANIMRKIHSTIPNVTEKQIFARFAQRENYKLTNNSRANVHALDVAEQQMEEGKNVDVAQVLDIPIEEKFNNAETTNIFEEVRNTPEFKSDEDFINALNNHIDDDAKEDINYADDALIENYKLDPRLLEDEEAQQLLKEIESGSDEFGQAVAEMEQAQPKKQGFQAQTMTIAGEEINKTDFDLIQKYQKTRKWNRENPARKRNIPQSQIDAYNRHQNIADNIFDMEFKQDKVSNDYITFDGLEQIDPIEQQLLDDGYTIDADGVLRNPQGIPLFAKFTDNLAAGTIAGVETDENGNITIDPEKFVAGLGGYTAIKALAKKGYFDNLPDEVNKAVKKYTGVELEPQIVAGEKAIIEADSINVKPNTNEIIKMYRGVSSSGEGGGESLIGKGLYLTPSKDIAQSYGEKIKTYNLENKNIYDATKEITDKEYKEILSLFRGKKGIEYMPDENIGYTYEFIKDDIGANTGIDYEDVAETINKWVKKKGYDGIYFDLSQVNDSVKEGEKAFLMFKKVEETK